MNTTDELPAKQKQISDHDAFRAVVKAAKQQLLVFEELSAPPIAKAASRLRAILDETIID